MIDCVIIVLRLSEIRLEIIIPDCTFSVKSALHVVRGIDSMARR